jgi:type I restriction enzyme S subunit
MTADLKPYPAYKNSGVPWLGGVPEEWEVRRIKTLFREKDERSRDGSGLLLSLTRVRGLLPQSQASNRLASTDDLSKYKVCRPGDLVMNRMQAWSGMFAVSALEGLVSPDYSVFTATEPCEVKYFEHLFKTPGVVDQFAQASKGIGSGFNRLYTPDFGAVPVVVPPPSEQAAIVRFLNHADRRIKRYIRAKQKLIQLLEEQKQAIIHRAVTRGLDPHVRLKPSGIEWLGDVPEHWGVTRLKFIATDIVDCLHATPVYSDDGAYPAIRTADVRAGELLLKSARRVDEEHYRRWTARMVPSAGDILYTREGERFGIAALVPDGVRLCISQRMMAFRIHERVSSAYVMWQINCRHVYAQAAADVIGAAAPHVNVDRIKNLWLVLPPRSEQGKIVAIVESACIQPNAAIERARAEINLLLEYHTRLIADVVTGELDVREAASKLPDETDEPESLNDAGAFVEDDEAAEGADLAAAADEVEA